MSSLAVAVPRAVPSTQRHAARALIRDRWALVAVTFLTVVILAAVLAPLLVPDTVNNPDFRARLKPPLTADHLLGTDQLGRDVFDRMLLGARVSLTVGFVAVFLSAVIGVPIGMLAGYFGGWLDLVLMRLA
ncbi:MAG: ABC transporter permease, partial [Chloroflexota bacterium]|nr:ABC transporter permease [Chloroflexota bacterium]